MCSWPGRDVAIVRGLVHRWTKIAGLIAGVILLDFGVQAGHVSNQTRIYALLPEARSRLNMVYVISYFTAGAIGSYTGTLAWSISDGPASVDWAGASRSRSYHSVFYEEGGW